mgnify:CR=1 FL=1
MDPQQQRLPVPTLLPWEGRLPDVADDAVEGVPQGGADEGQHADADES